MDFSNPISSIIAWAIAIIAGISGLVFFVAIAVWTYQWAVTFVHRAKGTGLYLKAASLERQRQILATSLLRAVELIDRLGDEGWGGLSQTEKRDAERDLEQIQHIAKGHNPNKRRDCILLP